MHGMHGPGEGSSPPEFRLEGFEKYPKGVKEAVARSGHKAGGYNNPAIVKRVSLWRFHLGRLKNAIRRDQCESIIFFLSLARGSSSIGLLHGIRVVIENPQG
jgi:hypothetical protein